MFDEAALVAGVTAALGPLERDPVDATIAMRPVGPVTTTARVGRSVDPGPIAAAAVAAVTGTTVPPEVALAVETVPVTPTFDDEAIAIARVRAQRMIDDVRVAFGKKSWTIKAATVRDWIRFEERADGSVVPVVDASGASATLAKATKAVAKAPVDAIFLKNRRGKAIGVVASRDGRALDVDATVARIAAEVEARGTGRPSASVAVAVATILPKLTTEEAQKIAPLMMQLGIVEDLVPGQRAQLLRRQHLAAREVHQRHGALARPDVRVVAGGRPDHVGSRVRARRLHSPNHTEPTGRTRRRDVLELDDAVQRRPAGRPADGRPSNHKYYINRYPLGLDATVSIWAAAGRRCRSPTT